MIEQAWNYRSVVAKDINNTEGCGSVSKYAPRYFKIDFDKADNLWQTILSISNADDAVNNSEIAFNIGALYKTKAENIAIIQAYPFLNIEDGREYSFCYMPLYIFKEYTELFGVKSNLLNFEDILENICKLLVETGKVEYDQVLSTDGLTEITEEEFYKID